MAIQSDNDNSAPSFSASVPPSAAPAPSWPTSSPAPQPQSNTQTPWTFSSIAMTGPISTTQGSDNLIKLRDKVTELIKDHNTPELHMRALVIDNQQHSGFYYSALVFCMRMPNAKVDGVAFYTMLLTSTNEMPRPKTEQVLNQTIENRLVPGDAFDSRYVERATKLISESFPGLTLYNAGGTTVPADFDANDATALQRLISNASTAVYAELSVRQPDFHDLNLSSARADSTLQVSVVFGRETIQNAVSEPMRSDLDVSFGSIQQSNNNESLNDQARRNEKFGKLFGFIDPVWAPVQMPQQGWGMYNQQQMGMLTQKYAARLVITHMESLRMPTLPAYLLLLLTALPVGMGNNWYHAFFNQTRFLDKKGGVDYTDVGALNIEANLPSAKYPNGNPSGIGDRVDTRAKDFTSEAFGIYMSRLFREGLLFSLDVPFCGPQTWYLEVFRAACDGNMDAHKTILHAANYLTNGHFEPLFTQAGPQAKIFVERNNIIHLGEYEDADGKKRDIRDIDHLAVVNAFAESDMSIVRKWSDSFLQTNRSLQMRLYERWNIIQAITKNRAVLTGYAERVTFTDAFLLALSHAASECGLNIRLNMPNTSIGIQAERGVATFVNQALVPSNIAVGVFEQGMGVVTNTPGNFGSNQYSRFR